MTQSAEEHNEESLLYVNGIDVTKGSYAQPPITPDDMVELARGARLNRKQFHYQDIEERLKQKDMKHLGVVENVNPNNLAESGWGVIFPYGFDPAIREALSELLDHRKHQANRHDERFYREFIGPDAYRAGDTKQTFLKRYHIGAGPIDPKKGVPYYLLLVADPETIPYSFQYQLDVQFSVGRIHFDTLDDYAYYARSVVEAESGRFALPKRAIFFAPRNPDDRATALSADELITPLVDELGKNIPGWTLETLIGKEQASKANLHTILHGNDAPALLFTASHGAVFPKDHPLQLAHQGALICQDWQGPYLHKGELLPNLYLSGDDIDPQTNLLGTIGFFFACYGGGTPKHDAFAYQKTAYQARDIPRIQELIAPHAFLAQLPKRMLCNPGGGALAVVGHVERAWGYSFKWGNKQSQIEVFVSTLLRLMQGNPLGSAMEYFNERYAEIAADLTMELEALEFSRYVDPFDLTRLWTANNDARNYTILGDPAVRLPIDASAAVATTRPAIGAIRTAQTTSTIPTAVTEVFAAVKGAGDGNTAPIAGVVKKPSTISAAVAAAVAAIAQKAAAAQVAQVAQTDTTAQTDQPTTQPTTQPNALPAIESFAVDRQPEVIPNTPTKTTTTTPPPTGHAHEQPTVEDAAIAQLYARWQAARAAEEKVRARTEEYLRDLQMELNRRYKLDSSKTGQEHLT